MSAASRRSSSGASAPDGGSRLHDPDLAAELLEQGFEPGAVTTRFETDNHLTLELLVESPHLLFVPVLQIRNDEFASFSFQITDSLLSCMKVNADIYCFHSASFQSPVTELS
jgi:hypothetical protein